MDIARSMSLDVRSVRGEDDAGGAAEEALSLWIPGWLPAGPWEELPHCAHCDVRSTFNTILAGCRLLRLQCISPGSCRIDAATGIAFDWGSGGSGIHLSCSWQPVGDVAFQSRLAENLNSGSNPKRKKGKKEKGKKKEKKKEKGKKRSCHRKEAKNSRCEERTSKSQILAATDFLFRLRLERCAAFVELILPLRSSLASDAHRQTINSRHSGPPSVGRKRKESDNLSLRIDRRCRASKLGNFRFFYSIRSQTASKRTGTSCYCNHIRFRTIK